MYLRVTQRKNKDGSTVQYYQLAHNQWDAEKKRSSTKVLFNFGRADNYDRDDLVRLCRSIARVCELVLHERPSSEMILTLPGAAENWPEKLQLIGTTELGSLHVIEGIWKQLGLRSILDDLCEEKKLRVPYERALFALVANRLCVPASKLGVWERWLSTVYLPSCWELGLGQLYQAMDLLCEHAEELEEMVFFRTADLFNLEVDLIFYDTTTAAFSVDFEDEDEELEPALRRWGREKDGGSKVQIVVALAVTKDGLPVRSWVFPGNTTDVTTIRSIREDLRAWKLGRCLFVGDRGMNSLENREELARACGRYVRADSAEVQNEVLRRGGRYKKLSENLRVKEVVVGEGEKRRRYVLCHNPQEAKRQKKRREEVVKGLCSLLEQHRIKHVRAKWTAPLRASRRTAPYLSVSRRGELYVDAEKVRKAEKFDGKWVLITNDDTLSSEEVAQSYRAMEVIERCFRSLKSAQIELRPMYHWTHKRIVAHVKICTLALLIQRIAELRCKSSWMRLRQSLCKLQATEFRTEKHQFFRRNSLPRETARILKTLKIQSPQKVLAIRELP